MIQRYVVALAVLALMLGWACTPNNPPSGMRPVGTGLNEDCSKSTCRAPLTCDAMTKKCVIVPTTMDGGTCTIGNECISGYCAPNIPQGQCATPGSKALGTSCEGDGDCVAGARCGFNGISLFPLCMTAGTKDIGAMCAKNADCAQGLYCVSTKCASLPVAASVAPHGFPPLTPDPSALWSGVACETLKTSGVSALWSIPRDTDTAAQKQDFFRLPFPNDAARGSNGRVDFSRFPRDPNPIFGFDALKRYLDVLETEPFSNYGSVVFRFDGSVNFSSIIADGANPNLRFINLGTKTARGLAYSLSGATSHYVCPQWFAVRPFDADPLPAGTYAVILLKGIKDTSGGDVQSSPDFDAMVAASAPSDPKLQAAYTAYAPLRSFLTSANIAASSVLTASVFTVGDPQRLMKKLASTVESMTAPTAQAWVKCGSGATSPCASTDGGVRACGNSNDFDEWHTLVDVPIFQQGTAPYLTPDEGGNMDFSGSTVALQRREKVCAALTVPKATTPTAGWPLLIYAHGTGGTYRSHAGDGSGKFLSNISLPSVTDPVRVAVLGFDQVGHGPRRGTSTESPDNIVFNFANPASARGTMAQGAADLMSFAKFAKTMGSTPNGLPLIDTSKIGFWGHSQGATEGAMFLAYDRTVNGAVMSGASASLTDALLSKRAPVDIAGGLWLALGESNPAIVSGFHPVLSLMQQWTDVVDPIHFDSRVVVVPAEGSVPTFSRHVFQVWGKSDTYTARPVQAMFGITAGLTWVGTRVEDYSGAPVASVQGNRTVTAAMRQYEPSGYDGHFVVFQNMTASNDAARFIGRVFRAEVPKVPEQ